MNVSHIPSPAGRAATLSGSKLHEDFSREEELAGPSNRRFGLTLATVCAAIAAVRLIFGHAYAAWWAAAALALLTAALLRPALLTPLNGLWLRLGLLLYKIVNPIIMALIYWSTIVPIGLLMRLCGKDPLRLRRAPEAPSYWIPREPPGPPAETMRNQF